MERGLTTVVDHSLEFSSEYSGLSEARRVHCELNLYLAITVIPEN